MINTNQFKKRKRNMTIIIISIIIIIAIIGILIKFNSASTQRYIKSLQSNLNGGLNRTVTVYDNNGKILKEWSGEIDIAENDYGNKVLFDLDGKRKTVYNAIVIVEEE